jgi:hypothetical protein
MIARDHLLVGELVLIRQEAGPDGVRFYLLDARERPAAAAVALDDSIEYSYI